MRKGNRAGKTYARCGVLLDAGCCIGPKRRHYARAPVFYTYRCAMSPESHVSMLWHLSDDRDYSQYRMPVTKPHVTPSELEFVIKQPELNLC